MDGEKLKWCAESEGADYGVLSARCGRGRVRGRGGAQGGATLSSLASAGLSTGRRQRANRLQVGAKVDRDREREKEREAGGKREVVTMVERERGGERGQTASAGLVRGRGNCC